VSAVCSVALSRILPATVAIYTSVTEFAISIKQPYGFVKFSKLYLQEFRSDFSRGHHVSSQRIRLQRRNRPCRYDIDKFTPSFSSIFESLVPSEEEIAKQRQLYTTLSRLITKEWPNSRLFLYGSCASSFGFSNSDIDLCLSIDDKEMNKVDIILKLADILKAGNLQNIQVSSSLLS
jgi:DNA polymerase sigma